MNNFEQSNKKLEAAERIQSRYDGESTIESKERNIDSSGYTTDTTLSEPINPDSFNQMTQNEYDVPYNGARKSSLEKDEKFKIIFDNVNDLIIILDKYGMIIDINKKVEDIFGIRQEQIIGKNIKLSDLLEIQDIQKYEHLFNKMVKEKDTINLMDFGVTDKNGNRIYSKLIARAIIKDGDIDCFLVIIKNINNQINLIKTLTENEKRFNDIAENAMEWIWEVDKTGRYIYSNSIVEKILGYPSEQILNMHFYDLFCPEEKEDLKNKSFQVFDTKQPFQEFINRNVHMDGRIIWLSTSGVPVTDEEGNLIGYRGVDTDITERKQSHEKLQESEEKFRTLIEQAVEGFVIGIGPAPRLVYSNNAMSEILGYTCDELTSLSSENIEKLVHPEDRNMFFSRFQDRLNGKTVPTRYEFRGIHKNGTVIWLLISSKRIYYNNQPAVMALFTDITDRKKSEIELKQKIDELERFEKVSVDRELKMVELKQIKKELMNKVEELEKKLNESKIFEREGFNGS